jgi:hypothetical protein
MAIVVVGGHSRNVGKTSVVAGLIHALADYRWTAMKITQYGHGVCSRNGRPCHCANEDHSWAISQEQDRSAKSDTSQFLASGADKVWWVRTEQGRLAEAMPEIRRRLAAAENVIVESNSILEFLRPDLYLTILDPQNADFKTSARRFLDRADAVIWHAARGASGAPAWSGVSLKPVRGRPRVLVEAPDYVSSEMLQFVRARLEATPVEGQS